MMSTDESDYVICSKWCSSFIDLTLLLLLPAHHSAFLPHRDVKIKSGEWFLEEKAKKFPLTTGLYTAQHSIQCLCSVRILFCSCSSIMLPGATGSECNYHQQIIIIIIDVMCILRLFHILILKLHGTADRLALSGRWINSACSQLFCEHWTDNSNKTK